MKIANKPYYLLMFTGFIFVLMSFLPANANSNLDIHLHDTYFIILFAHLFLASSILVLGLWLFYLLLNKVLFSNILTWIHVITSIAALTTILSCLHVSNSAREIINYTPHKYIDFSNSNYIFMLLDDNTKVFAIALGIFILGQISFLANLVVGLFKHRNLKNIDPMG